MTINTNNTETTAATVSVLDILGEARKNTEYADQLCDYSGSTCIDDAFHEIADGNTSIYYSDIIKYISDHVEEINDAIAEFGWDGCGADLYKAGQMAEYLGILRDLEENTADAVTIWAADYIRHLYGETISADAWQAIADALENIDSSDYLDDIAEAVDAVLDPGAAYIEDAREIVESGNYPAAVALMDDELREELHRTMAPGTSDIGFLAAYMAAHLGKFGEEFAI